MADSSFDPTFLNLPIRAISIRGTVFPVVTQEATINRGINRHDTVELTALIAGTVTFDGKVRIPLDADMPTSGTTDVDIQTLDQQPVSFVFGVSPRTEQFIGYVTGVSPAEKFKEGISFKIMLTGASVVMQRVIRRFDRKLTTQQAISDRAETQGLGLVHDTHEHVWTSIAQTSETDWEMSVALATIIGFVVVPHGAVVRVVDPLQLFRQYPFTSLTTSDDLLESDRKLMDFVPVETSSNLIDAAGIEVWYFDSDGQVRSLRQQLSSSTPSWTPLTSRAVESRAEAEMLVRASESSTKRWTQGAIARIKGDGSIYPGVIVNVNSQSSDPQFQGRWLVANVNHSMTRTAFQTELSLIRPKSIPRYDTTTFQPYWDKLGSGKPTVFLREQQWYSSLANPRARAA